MQRSWANRIRDVKSKSAEEYVAMRVRILMRRTGVMPSEDEINALVQKEMTAPKAKDRSEQSAIRDCIQKALLQG